jgi:hypothetical protein
MHVRVEEKHIKNGECSSPWKCAIALAINDIENVEESDVGNFTAGIRFKDGTRKEYILPEQAVDFIALFDGKQDARPFEFDLIAYLKY